MNTKGNSIFSTHLILEAQTRFKTALADDINISAALSVLFDLIREANGLIDQNKIGDIEAQQILQMLESWDQVLALLPLHKPEEIPLHFIQLLELREEARRTKNWQLSDQLRDEILSKGFLIEDTPAGARLKKKT